MQAGSFDIVHGSPLSLITLLFVIMIRALRDVHLREYRAISSSEVKKFTRNNQTLRCCRHNDLVNWQKIS